MKKLWLESALITVFVFLMLWGANNITDLKLFTGFDPISQALKDFHLTDIAFSKIRKAPLPEERIILVNLGTLTRREIAQQIRIINEFKPRVIGLDALLSCEGGLRDTINCPALRDPIGNYMLAEAIREAGNVVLASKVLLTKARSDIDTDQYDSLEVIDSIFSVNSKPGYVNLPTDAKYQEDIKQCRSIFPRLVVNGQEQLYFGVQIAKQYDSARARKFLDRGNQEELINFRGNIEVLRLLIKSEKNKDASVTEFTNYFYVIDADQLLNGEFLGEIMRDNIVIMGYMGDYLGDTAWEDKFFTPLNKIPAGRANPDMFGPVVHANAVAMIINEDFVDEIPEWIQYSIAFVVGLLTVAFFFLIDDKLPHWFDALSVLIQVVEVLLISLLVVQAFAWWSLNLELSVAIGISALTGPTYDIYKSIKTEIQRGLDRRQQRKLQKAQARAGLPEADPKY